ncbi:MAG: hypothetical protein IT336_10230 [Thermomicrobiales bacterium]|nr:hypothetical protein [Thermomicrobiales bacterium]
MDFDLKAMVGGELTDQLPETPHELPYNRGRVDDVLDRARAGESMNLLTELLNCVEWRAVFVEQDGQPITLEDITRLMAYYRVKFQDIGPLYIAELLSTEFMTEQRARGDIVFSERLMKLGREEPQLWQEIRQFFRRKEFATALLASAHAKRGPAEPTAAGSPGEA